MYEGEFREYIKSTDGASWEATTTEVLEALGAEAVFEGPQATGGTVYQYSQRDGVEQQSDGKWYTKYILGPVFTDGETTAAAQEAAYKSQKDKEQATNVRASRDTLIAKSDWTQCADISAALKPSGRPIGRLCGTFPSKLDFHSQLFGPPKTSHYLTCPKSTQNRF